MQLAKFGGTPPDVSETWDVVKLFRMLDVVIELANEEAEAARQHASG